MRAFFSHQARHFCRAGGWRGRYRAALAMPWSSVRAVIFDRSVRQSGLRARLTAASLAAAASLALPPAAHANFEIDLVPPGYGFVSGGGCFGTFCSTNLESSDFQLTSPPIFVPDGNGYDEQFYYTATYTGAFTDSQGNLIGNFSVQGTDVFTVFMRDSLIETGTFDAQLTSESVHVGDGTPGVLGGHQLGLQLDPGFASDGTATFTDAGNGTYIVSSTFNVNADLAVDGGSFFYAGGPFPITETQVGVPEPASLELVAMGLALLVPLRRRHG
jgi:hypothetical protein